MLQACAVVAGIPSAGAAAAGCGAELEALQNWKLSLTTPNRSSDAAPPGASQLWKRSLPVLLWRPAGGAGRQFLR